MKIPHKTSQRTALCAAHRAPRLALVVILAALTAPVIFAQDSSGNSLLNGSYRFRYVAALNYNTADNVSEVAAAEGVITFLNGSYTISLGSQYIDNTENSGAPQEFPSSAGGTYVINSAGLGYITNPLLSDDQIFGTFSNGVFTGSSTESGVNDLFVAILPGTPPTNSSFTSPYWIGALDFAAGSDVDVKNALFEIQPNGSGSLGTLNIQGQANSQTTALTQTVTGATYSFGSDGNANLTIPAPSGVSTPAVMVSGSRSMYVSADGNYVLGWSPTGYDIFFGVKASTTPYSDSVFSGLFYIGDMNDLPLECGATSFWGSVNADGVGDEVMHQRLLNQYCSYTGAVTDYGTDDYTQANLDGTVSDALGYRYAFGAGGKGFVGISDPSDDTGYFALTIGVQAPSYTPSGIFLSPVGVVNGANWDPVTASVAPGELITLFGSNLASTTQISTGGLPFPTILGNVEVLINNVPAPIYYVSPTQVSVIAPYELVNSTTYTAEIQVNNGGFLSTPISVYLTDAESGIFSQGQNGIGTAIAEHADGSDITEDSPAQPGETIVLALTGMGTVTPTVTDGAVGPPSPFSYADNYTAGNLLVLFNDYNNNSTEQQATISFAGLYPGLAGLYQMNVVVPTTVGPGDVYVEVVSDYADVEQVTVPVGGTANASAQSRLNLAPSLARPKHQKIAAHKRRTPKLIQGGPRKQLR